MGEKDIYRLYVDRAEDLPALREQLRMATASGRSDVLRRAGYESLSQQERVTGILDGRCARLTTVTHDAVYDYYRTVQDRKNYHGVVPDDVALLIAAIEGLRVFSKIEQRHSKNGEVIVVGIVNSTPPQGQKIELIADYVLAQWGLGIPEIGVLVQRHAAKVQKLVRIRNRVLIAGAAGWVIGLVLGLTLSHWLVFVAWPFIFSTHLTAILNKKRKRVMITAEVLFAFYLISILTIIIVSGLGHSH